MNVILLFGGQSSEHEISRMSARNVLSRISGHTIEKIGITRSGKWFFTEASPEEILDGSWEKHPSNTPAVADLSRKVFLKKGIPAACDVVFPILHGKNGEDGTVQGLLEILGIPYVGCGVLASAVCMDKITANQVFTANKIGHVAWLGFDKGDYAEKKENLLSAIEELGFPVFIKPSNAGSSVGITRCDQKEQLEPAIQEALQVDDRIVAEKGLKNFKEIEVAVLGNHRPIASRPGRILSATEVYTYESKYQNQDSRTLIPADITPQTAEKIRQTAVKAYRACGCTGLSRVDFFLTEDNRIYLNEINTLPGFTSISMFPRLFADAGIDYPELIDRLLHDAVEK